MNAVIHNACIFIAVNNNQIARHRDARQFAKPTTTVKSMYFRSHYPVAPTEIEETCKLVHDDVCCNFMYALKLDYFLPRKEKKRLIEQR